MNPEAPSPETLLQVLRHVMDPELDCNIVDLGLVNGVEYNAGNVRVFLTPTTPGCPMHHSLVAGIQTLLLSFPEITAVEVETVWDPPWTPDRITGEARTRLGIL